MNILLKNYMPTVNITKNEIKLLLTQAISKVRVADQNGNHVRKPAGEGRNSKGYFIEWMITNAEIKELIRCYLDKKDCQFLKQKLQKINRYLKGSKFAIRSATKEKLPKTFMNFEVYAYKEKFYSFEKKIDTGIRIRLTFKMGDFALAVHMFVLLAFEQGIIKLFNRAGAIGRDEILGSGAYAVWQPNKQAIFSIIESLAYASDQHKNDLMRLLDL